MATPSPTASFAPIGRRRRLPLWIKIAYSTLVAVIVPAYALEYGPLNFLWFSDIALIVLVAALWLEHRLLVSMMAVGTLLLELAWNIDFAMRLALGATPFGLTGYMFNTAIPLWIRALSCFHIILPPLMLWMLHRLGYDSRAWVAQSTLAWIVLPVTYLATDPTWNINWAFGWGTTPQTAMHPLLYLGLLMLFLPAVVFLPTHWVLRRLFATRESV